MNTFPAANIPPVPPQLPTPVAGESPAREGGGRRSYKVRFDLEVKPGDKARFFRAAERACLPFHEWVARALYAASVAAVKPRFQSHRSKNDNILEVENAQLREQVSVLRSRVKELSSP